MKRREHRQRRDKCVTGDSSSSASFTLLALDLPGSAPQDLQPHPVQSIMQCFGWDDMVQPALITRYLPHLLQNRLSVRSWFRCVLQQHLQKNPDGSDSRTGRDVEGQLCELTRLVLRLPEAVGAVYSGLQVLSERSAMATRALDYIGDVLKHIKPSLVSKNQEGLQLVYWAVGCIVKHWSPLLATSKAQQLLFRISQGAHLKQQLRSVIRRYLDHFLPASPSMGVIANHPVLLSACEATPTGRGAALRRTILEVLWWVSGSGPTTEASGLGFLDSRTHVVYQQGSYGHGKPGKVMEF
ncbi:Protein MMS22-like [Liparis tanakae]|uniref:Protein MMS22-like n=1 Tax=Liparis tanakae TaxID=230148 RepID=A0A4Z2EM05_9TELE|nr:Protein MMS22-like [Liparis tanakae]